MWRTWIGFNAAISLAPFRSAGSMSYLALLHHDLFFQCRSLN